MRVLIYIVLLISFPSLLSVAQENELLKHNRELPDKSGYNFLLPTPRKFMREFSTDRPDVTESAYSVDAGHFQVEMDVLKLTKSSLGSTHQNELGFAHSNFKFGLTNRSDIQIVIESYIIQSTKTENKDSPEKKSNLGDIYIRYKYNLWGNDKGKTALAAMPFVKLPTNSSLGNGTVEAGIIFPFAMQLPSEWTFGGQLEYEACKNSANKFFHHEFSNTITVGHDIYKTLGGFIELASYMNSEGYTWKGTFNGGITLRPVENVQLDAGVNVALTKESDDIYFLGFSFRY